MRYDKLVRDKIPELIRKSGETPITRILEDAEYREHLEKKLDEEVAEYHKDKNIEELADILEVVYTLNETLGHTRQELMAAYEQKHTQRGGFSDRIFLISKESL